MRTCSWRPASNSPCGTETTAPPGLVAPLPVRVTTLVQGIQQREYRLVRREFADMIRVSERCHGTSTASAEPVGGDSADGGSRIGRLHLRCRIVAKVDQPRYSAPASADASSTSSAAGMKLRYFGPKCPMSVISHIQPAPGLKRRERTPVLSHHPNRVNPR